MKNLFIAALISLSTAAHADLGTLMKIQAGVALGKQALDASKQIQLPPEQKPGARSAPAPGSIEQACVTALNQELDAILRAISREAEIKRDEARLEIHRILQKLTPASDGNVKILPGNIASHNKTFDRNLAEVSQFKLTRERICDGLL